MAIGNLDPSADQKFVEKLEASLEKKEDEVSKVFPTPPTSRPMKTATKTQVAEGPFHRKAKRPKVKTTKRPKAKKAKRPEGQTAKRPKGRTAVWPKKETIRRKTRHGFDIFEDQVFSLKEIQLRRQRETGKRYLLGDLAKEALDMFITKEYAQD
jgi:hypothetical protein